MWQTAYSISSISNVIHRQVQPNVLIIKMKTAYTSPKNTQSKQEVNWFQYETCWGRQAITCSKVNLQLSVEKLSLLYLTVATSNMITEWRAKGGKKKLQNFIRILMFLILHKATRRAAGWSPNALKIKTYGNHMWTCYFSELAAFLKFSSPWWKMLCKRALHSVAKISFFILKPQINHQWCPQE